MQISRALFILVMAIMTGLSVSAQNQSAKKTVNSYPKFKPPVLITVLGTHKSSTTIGVQEAEALIGMPLKITDSKNNQYTVSSYQFLYRKKGVTEDEATGKLSPATTISSSLFKQTPLPKIWVEKIREEVKQGEELYFFDVIARDNNGRVLYAPELKLTVQ